MSSSRNTPMLQDQHGCLPGPIVIAALYQFATFVDLEALQTRLLDVASDAGTKGSLLIAPEGINGTVAGTRTGIDTMLAEIRALPGCESLEHKESFAQNPPFGRMKVRIKREIVTMGIPAVDPGNSVGTYVAPRDWNALISQPGMITIDTRNAYEVEIGTFKGALNPGTQSFRELPGWLAENLPADKTTKVAMFCTGGIRCEKSTSYLKNLGYTDVYHLAGGILKYLEEVPPSDSLWDGACFVFDERVSIEHGLKPGNHRICKPCGRPVPNGKPCPHCKV